jgi:hypothetical protein
LELEKGKNDENRGKMGNLEMKDTRKESKKCGKKIV